MKNLATYGVHSHLCRTSEAAGERQSLRFLVAFYLILAGTGVIPNHTLIQFAGMFVMPPQVDTVIAACLVFFAGLILFGEQARFAAASMMTIDLAAITVGVTQFPHSTTLRSFAFDIVVFVALALCAKSVIRPRERPKAEPPYDRARLIRSPDLPVAKRTAYRPLNPSGMRPSLGGNRQAFRPPSEELHQLFEQIRDTK